jgi:hypothetical protein
MISPSISRLLMVREPVQLQEETRFALMFGGHQTSDPADGGADVLDPRGPDAMGVKLVGIAVANVAGKTRHEFTDVGGPGDNDPEQYVNVFGGLSYVSPLIKIYDGFGVLVEQVREQAK